MTTKQIAEYIKYYAKDTWLDHDIHFYLDGEEELECTPSIYEVKEKGEYLFSIGRGDLNETGDFTITACPGPIDGIVGNHGNLDDFYEMIASEYEDLYYETR